MIKKFILIEYEFCIGKMNTRGQGQQPRVENSRISPKVQANTVCRGERERLRQPLVSPVPRRSEVQPFEITDQIVRGAGHA